MVDTRLPQRHGGRRENHHEIHERDEMLFVRNFSCYASSFSVYYTKAQRRLFPLLQEGGCHGHLVGTEAGAAAIKKSLNASLKNIPLKEYAKTHSELKYAINKFRITR